MGTGASILSSTFETAVIDKSMFSENNTDTDVTYEKNIITLKSILKNDGWKSSLFKYLQDIKKECILSWYFDLDEYYRTKATHKRAKAIEIRARYDPCNQTMPLSKTWVEIWEVVTETLPISNTTNTFNSLSPSKTCFVPSSSSNVGLRQDMDAVLNKHYNVANEYVFVLLIDELPGFLTSSRNQEWFSNSSKDNNRVKENNDSVYEDKSNVLKNEWKEEYSEILIIDDSIINAQMVAKCLVAYGHKVRCVNHGRIGLNIATTRKFSFILINMDMKTMCPHELAQRIKAWAVSNCYMPPSNQAAYSSSVGPSSQHNLFALKSSKSRSVEYFRESSLGRGATTGNGMNSVKTAEAQALDERYQWLPNIVVGYNYSYSSNETISPSIRKPSVLTSTATSVAAAMVSHGITATTSGTSVLQRNSTQLMYPLISSQSTVHIDYVIQLPSCPRLCARMAAYQSSPALVDQLYRIIKQREESDRDYTNNGNYGGGVYNSCGHVDRERRDSTAATAAVCASIVAAGTLTTTATAAAVTSGECDSSSRARTSEQEIIQLYNQAA